MRKYLFKAISLLCILALLTALVACGNGESGNTESGEIVYHTVSFNTNGGTAIASVEVRNGRKISEPEIPVLENYIFCHWEMSDGRTWFFDSKSVTEDITLDAVWIKAEDLFGLAPMPDGNGIMITEIKRQEEFSLLKIPSVINGKEVRGIADGAFIGVHKNHAERIVFPDTLTYIGAEAFTNASEVILNFTGTVTYLGESAFDNAASLSKISLGEGLESIAYRAFMNCTSLRTIDIPKGVTVIEENAFEMCSSLVTIVLPASLTSVESNAFEDCDKLKTVFYHGTEQEYDNMSIASGNEKLEDARVYYYSEEEPAEEGVFWHYDRNGSPVIW